MPRKEALEPRRKPQQARSKKLVGWILHAATQVFETHGYAAGTTNRIAERAGISIGSLYHYFPNKEAILVALATQHLEAGRDLALSLLTQAHDASLSRGDLIRLFVRGFLELHESNPQLHRLLFEEVPLPASVWEAYNSFLQSLTQAVAELLSAHPDIHVPNPHLTAYLLVHTAEGLTHTLTIHPPAGIDREACVVELERLLESYLS